MNKKEKMPTEISLLWAPNISAIAIMVDDVRMSAEDVKREYPLYSKQLSDMFNVELEGDEEPVEGDYVPDMSYE